MGYGFQILVCFLVVVGVKTLSAVPVARQMGSWIMSNVKIDENSRSPELLLNWAKQLVQRPRMDYGLIHQN